MKNSPTIQSIKNLKTLRNVCFNEDIIKTLEKCVKEGLKFNMIYSDPDYNVDIKLTLNNIVIYKGRIWFR